MTFLYHNKSYNTDCDDLETIEIEDIFVPVLCVQEVVTRFI